MAMRLILTVYAFIIGLCFGSFALATAWRLKKKKSFGGKQRSQCEHCKHVLHAVDLVPLISWISLRGRCRYCRTRLSPLYPAAELLGGIAVAASYYYWPSSLSGALASSQFAVWLIELVLLLILFFYDMQWYILPNKVMYPLWGVSVLSFLLTFFHNPSAKTLLHGALAVVVGAGVFFVLHELSKGKWIGFGDVRLGLAIGLLIGTPLLAALVIFVASVLGVIAATPDLIRKKRSLSSRLPFGPLLIVALILVRLFGQRVVDWYAVHILYL